MRRGRRSERMGVNGEINVVSLIDVMMLLMVIFMITAPIMQGGVDIALPTADVRPLEPKNGLVVTVDQRGQIFVDETRLSYEEFAGSIKALSEKKGGGGVYLRADEAVPYGRVVQIVAAMRANGITDVGLVAEPEDPR
ncbi:MAG TPA: biopolymer transporter ExbD [Gemmatimonas aurantiaca]|uniref:Biopolymer transporter ExbD n=2 Tax=Gemmatimonas aurantiaca TaxID=173480 RepID=A0A3D4V924_9BACT|nr:biopolymer transporter ExbD [Gemmatimonas aurantiaca]BAH38986.1 putative biopolymer transport protein [Gemmatimonas aurantiaca T-27]HCT57128.1 biopolymer transporter ExbD [Gemmatimonas aurantiaca]